MCDSFDKNLSLCSVKRRLPSKDQGLPFLRFWTDQVQKKNSYKYFVSFSSCAITEAYLELSRTVTMDVVAKIVNDWKPLTISVKSFIVDVLLGSKYAPGLDCYQTILLLWLFIYIRTSKILQEWPYILLQKFFLKKTLAYSQTELHFSRNIG